jgi:hypothetical protein
MTNLVFNYVFNYFIPNIFISGVCLNPGSAAGRRKRDIPDELTAIKVVKRQATQTLAQLALRSYGAQLT